MADVLIARLLPTTRVATFFDRREPQVDAFFPGGSRGGQPAAVTGEAHLIRHNSYEVMATGAWFAEKPRRSGSGGQESRGQSQLARVRGMKVLHLDFVERGVVSQLAHVWGMKVPQVFYGGGPVAVATRPCAGDEGSRRLVSWRPASVATRACAGEGDLEALSMDRVMIRADEGGR